LSDFCQAQSLFNQKLDLFSQLPLPTFNQSEGELNYCRVKSYPTEVGQVAFPNLKTGLG